MRPICHFPAQNSIELDRFPACTDSHSGENQPSAAGEWRGSYVADTQRQTRVFTAEMHAAPFGEVNLYGIISNGEIESVLPGNLIGSQSGTLIRFSQTKQQGKSTASGGECLLEFVGYISGDGAVMRGRWREACPAGAAEYRCGGSWMARRD